MRSFSLWLLRFVFFGIPSTRFYRIKSLLLSACGVKIAKSTRIVSSVRIIGTGELNIGDDTFIGHGVSIYCSPPGIVIGSYVDIAPNVTIVNGSHQVDMVGLHTAGTGLCKQIIIEDGVWIGASSTILTGVKIGRKSIIAAGAVVTSDVPEYSMSAGVPAKTIKIWHREVKAWKDI